jgi:hypothetical protein
MTYYVTRINFSKLSSQDKEKLMEALEYCRTHDKYGTFQYRITGETVRIISPDKKTAKLRGYYFKIKFNVYFNILMEKEKQANEPKV